MANLIAHRPHVSESQQQPYHKAVLHFELTFGHFFHFIALVETLYPNISVIMRFPLYEDFNIV